MNSGPACTKIAKSAKAPGALLPLLSSCKKNSSSVRGTVILVTLCFVAVLGIVLASYLAVCSRAMQLSNRAFQNDLSKQLAEAAIEEGLRAFNKNLLSGTDTTAALADWSNGTTSVDWTLDTTNKRATATVTFPSTKFGQGTTATVKIRIDNYDAYSLGSSWNTNVAYRLNDLVGYNGIWYRSVKNSNTGNLPADTSQNPNLAWWVPAPIRWLWNSYTSYSEYDVVNYNGTWYRYISSSSTSANLPTNTTYWVSIPQIALNWVSGTSYPFGAVVYYAGAWYYSYQRAGSATTAAPTNTSYWMPMLSSVGAESTWTSSTYAVGDTFYAGDYIYRASDKWYRCIATSPYAYVSGDYADTSKWVSASKPFISWAYQAASTAIYAFNDTVYYRNTSGTDLWYRRDISSTATGFVPTNTTYWQQALMGDNTTASPGVQGWSSSSVVYQPGDVVYYYGSSTSQWFRCIKSHTSSTTLTPASTTYWTGTPLCSPEWDSNRQYGLYEQVRYKGIWFLSLTATNAGNLPMESGSSNWAAAPVTVTTWGSSTTYYLDDLVSYSGSWYRCIRPNSGQTPTNTSYWWPLTGAGSSYVWSSSTGYSSGQYRSYNGAWYKCISSTTANSGLSPNNTSNWTGTWASPTSTAWGISTGVPVVFAEATLTLGDNTTTRTQLRALIAPAPLFPNAAASTTTLTIGSSGGTIDSYDGSVRAINTDGTGSYDTFDYDEFTNTPFVATNHNKGYSAILASSSSASSAITINNTTAVSGYLALPTPGSGISSNTTVWGYSSPASPKVDTSRVSKSPYIPSFDILQSASSAANYLRGRTLPAGTVATTAGTPSVGYTINIGTPGGVAPARYNYTATLNIGNPTYGIGTLNINGPVILYVNGPLYVRAGGRININPTGSLVVRCTYPRTYTSGNGYDNRTLDPKKLFIVGDGASTTVSAFDHGSSTTPDFYGAVYLPNTTATYGMDIKTGVNVYGALSGREITFTAEADLHYDTSLRYATFPAVDQPYTVTNWTELSTTEAATMP